MEPGNKLSMDWRGGSRESGSQFLTTTGRRSLLESLQIGGGEGGAYFPISEVVKRSLRVPPVTERNAELKRPVMKRKTMRTADGQGGPAISVILGRPEETIHTSIGGKCHRPGEDKETGERPQVHRIPA